MSEYVAPPPVIERLEKARVELAQRRFPRDPDDPLIDYALDLADTVTG